MQYYPYVYMYICVIYGITLFSQHTSTVYVVVTYNNTLFSQHSYCSNYIIIIHYSTIIKYPSHIQWNISGGKHLWFINNIRYVGNIFAVCPQPPILVYLLQSRKMFNGKIFVVSKNPREPWKFSPQTFYCMQ